MLKALLVLVNLPKTIVLFLIMFLRRKKRKEEQERKDREYFEKQALLMNLKEADRKAAKEKKLKQEEYNKEFYEKADLQKLEAENKSNNFEVNVRPKINFQERLKKVAKAGEKSHCKEPKSLIR